jgi:hypothetical protein
VDAAPSVSDNVRRARRSVVVRTPFILLPFLLSCSTDPAIIDPGGLPSPADYALADECARPAAGWIWCDDFEQNRLSSYFEYTQRNGAFVRVAGVGVAGSQAMRASFSQGQTDAGSLKLAFGRTPASYFRAADAGAADYRDIYWRFYLRNESGWSGGGGDKLTRAIVFANSNWAEAAIGHLWSGGSSNPYILVLDPASGTDAQGSLRATQYNDFANFRWLGGRSGQLAIFAAANVGRWYCVEAHMKLNDAGQSNGIFEFWIDGALQAQSTTLNWVGSYRDYGINAVFLENFWNAGSPRPQSRFFDNFIISTARIGCA